MVIVAVNHRVADFDKWKAVYDGFPPGAGGAKFARVNRSLNDPNVITVVAGFESKASAEGFLGNTQLGEAMKQAGVIGEPRIELYEEVESVQY